MTIDHNLQPVILRRNRDRYNKAASILRESASDVAHTDEAAYHDMMVEADRCEDRAGEIEAILNRMI